MIATGTLPPPPETEALKYYPPTGTVVTLPSVDYVQWSVPQGWRSCDNCQMQDQNMVTGNLLICGGCSGPTYWAAHYCRCVGRRCDLCAEGWTAQVRKGYLLTLDSLGHGLHLRDGGLSNIFAGFRGSKAT